MSFSVTGYHRDVFIARFRSAQQFRRNGKLFEALCSLADCRNARNGRHECADPEFPNEDAITALARTLWNRGKERAGYA